VEQDENERNYHLIWRCFNAFKFNKANEQFLKAEEKLGVEKPLREDFERKIDTAKRI